MGAFISAAYIIYNETNHIASLHYVMVKGMRGSTVMQWEETFR